MIKILGLDCSSTTIGWGVLIIDDITKTITLKDFGYIKPIKSGSIIERIVNTRDVVAELIKEQLPDYIVIEDIIKFMKGKSSADTIITLTSFNRMIALLAHDLLNRYPLLFNVLSIRHGIKINKKLPTKEEIPDLVGNHLNIQFPYYKNAKGKIEIESYDVADGIAVALYYAFILTGKIKAPKPKLIIEKTTKPKKVKQ
jgi:Holliday junction resolvasome RuvABC endonuclease subunit